MNPLYRLAASLPSSYRQRLKYLVATYFDVGRKSFYSQFGEDAYVQSYFREQFFALNPSQTPPLFAQSKYLGPGYFVDVGAYAPKIFSNSYFFYKHGWRGINIDGAPGGMKAFDKVRPQDKNIEAVISDVEAEMDFYHWESPFLINTLSPEMAAHWAKALGRDPSRIRVKSQRLDRILDEHLPRDQAISFMSVDVEGHDLPVLRSNNWERYRPEIVLVEHHVLHADLVAQSSISEFMSSVGYDWCAWVGPTVIFRDSRRGEFRFSHDRSCVRQLRQGGGVES